MWDGTQSRRESTTMDSIVALQVWAGTKMPMGSYAHKLEMDKGETTQNILVCKYSIGEITSVPEHMTIPTLDKVSECGKKIQQYFQH